MRKIEIESSRLRLCLPDVSEAHSALAYFQDNHEHLQPTNPTLPQDFYTLAFWEKRLAKSIEEFETDASVRFFFEKPETPGRFVGTANFTQISRGAFQACYLGYGVHHQCEGQGVMFEGLQRAIQFMFEDRHLHRIMANYLPENGRSGRLLARLGFRVDGESPEYLFIRGAWRDHVMTSLTNKQWSPRDVDRAIFP